MPIQNKDTTAASVPTPPAGSTTLFTEAGDLKSKNDAGVVVTIGTGGTVTSVSSGSGLTGGPITTTGTISLDTASIASLASADTALQSGDNITELTNDAAYTTDTGTVTSVGISSSGTITVGGTPVTTSGTLTVDLPTTAVTPASYTYSSITVDAYGRITAASSGTAPSATPPAGSNTEIQFNNSGAFGASSSLTFDSATSTLGLGNGVKITGAFNDATNSPYFQANAGTDTRLRVRAPTATATGQANLFAIGSSDPANSSFVLLRSTGDNTSTTGPRILWGNNSGNVDQNETRSLSFFTRPAGSYIAVATINPGTSAVASTDLVRKSDLDAAKAPKYEIATATAAQTVFNTTLTTTANGSGKAFLQVFVNGVKQVEGGGYAYTVTGTTQITFNAGLVGGEAVEFYAFN